MVIKKLSEVPFAELKGYHNVEKKIVIGPEDGSQEIIMRHFSLKEGGVTAHHSHDFPHLVKIEAGKGIVIDPEGNEHNLQVGDYIYVKSNESHQLKNTGTETFSFICVVPERGEI